MYLAAVLGNILIITTVACDHHLHTPMHFFLLNLSVLDLCSIFTTLPKSMANLLWDTRVISYSGCAPQVFMFVFLITTEYYLLTVMVYDRLVAICRPRHYRTLISSRVCVKMATAVWGIGFLHASLHTVNTFLIPLCQGNVVERFFCEILQILKICCSDLSYLREVGVIMVNICLGLVCFIYIAVSYVQIFRAVLRIPSEQGRHKTFSTCLPHLVMVCLFINTGTFAYLKPSSIFSLCLNLVVAVLYAVLPPAVNPLIYTMKKKELRHAPKKLILSILFQQQ